MRLLAGDGRRRTALRPSLFWAALVLLPGSAAAHGFGRLYNLPVPFWLYAWAAAAALLLSFLVAAFHVAAPPAPSPTPAHRRSFVLPGAGLTMLRALALGLLLLCLVTALLGNRDPYRNFSMTWFWVWFVLGFAYATALLGNLYAAVNPWQTLAGLLTRPLRGLARGRLAYPQALGDWPALLLFLGFIAFELFGRGRPRELGSLLLGYSLLNLAGVWLIGAHAWFRHCEFFSVFLGLVARIAPLRWIRRDDGRWAVQGRAPLSALVDTRPAQLSTVVFVLAMLSTTAFDGLKATQAWVGLFWADPTGLVTQLAGARPIAAYPLLRPWYLAWELCWLLLSPFLYFGVYGLCVALARGCARSRRPLRELALDFAYPLLPIALVYHISHYATLLLTQGPKIVSLASDPFGWNWNLWGSAMLLRAPILPEPGWVWHAQVGLILLGHLLGIVLSHRVALRVFENRRAALLSQLPMLLWMVALTVAGLWILAQPLTTERLL